MSYAIQFRPSAARAMEKLPRSVQARIRDAVDRLAEDPFPPGVKKLAGESGYRLRVGDYRVIYDVSHRELIVLVVRVGHRPDVYR
jgi:mRNA interferase RelE/StbE